MNTPSIHDDGQRLTDDEIEESNLQSDHLQLVENSPSEVILPDKNSCPTNADIISYDQIIEKVVEYQARKEHDPKLQAVMFYQLLRHDSYCIKVKSRPGLF